jgi:hypothetical protein
VTYVSFHLTNQLRWRKLIFIHWITFSGPPTLQLRIRCPG